MAKINNWRESNFVRHEDVYFKKFAIFPVKLSNGNTILWKSYYKKYRFYPKFTSEYLRKEFVDSISKEDYLILVLSGDI